jgi:hypothetical protein
MATSSSEYVSVLLKRSPTLRSALIGPAILFVITAGIFWKLVLTHQYTWLDNPDAVNQILPWYQFQAAEWHRGVFPLWDPYHWGGQSLIGQGQPGAAYPLNWILFLLPLKNGFIRQSYLHWYFVLIHYLGALFCYWLGRDLKRSRTASILAGVVFGLSGYCGSVDWPQMLNGAIWAPLVFLFFLRAMRGEAPLANSALAGAALGVSFLSGHHQAPVFISLAVGGAWIYFWIRAEVPRARIAALAALFAVFVVLTSGLQVLPIYEYGKLSLRWVGGPDPVGWDDKVPYLVHANFSLGPLAMIGLVIPRIFRHVSPFAGLVAVSLALLAAAGSWRDPMVRLLGGIAAGGLLFSLGGNSVFHGMIYALLPVVEKARVPAMAMLIFNLGVAVLAAYGLDTYRSQPQDWLFARRLSYALAAFSGALFTGIFVFTVVRPDLGFSMDEATLAALAALLLTALLVAWRSDQLSGRAAGVLLVLLLIFETGASTGYYYRRFDQPGFFLQRMGDSADIAHFLKAQPFPLRADIDRDLLPFNWGDWYGLDEFEGYCGVTRNVIENHGDAKFRSLFAINYYVGAKPDRPGQIELFQSVNGLRVYRNPGARPWIWTAHEAIQVRDSTYGLGTLDRADFDPEREVYVLETPPKLETCAKPDRAHLVLRDSNRLVIEANMGCRGMVIASETFSPGWQATVDGTPARIYEAYSVLRGVVAGAGPHRIEMRYRPASVFVGAAMTAAGLAGALIFSILARKRRQQRI